MRYRQTQRAPLLCLALMAPGILAIAVLWDTPYRIAGVLLGALFFALVLLFGSLTILIDETHVRWHFGIGVIKKSIALAEIQSAERVRNKWWYGWGIRYTPHGWLYNVSGLDAVQLNLETKAVRLGTNNIDRLHSAILHSIR